MGRLFKEKLAKNQLVRLFAVSRIPSPVVIDLFGLAGGFDGFWIDQEHGGINYEQIMIASVAARANGMDCFVRMAPTDYALVTQNLEAGAGGVMAARIESSQHAEQFVRWAKFAPRGNRGMNSSGRDADYTFKSQTQFAQEANRDHFLAIQIETTGALEQADEIAAIDGVDLLFIGPSDLSQALGLLGQLEHPKVWEGYQRVAAACRQHGKHWGTVAPTPAFAERAYELGSRMINLGGDVPCLRKGIEDAKQANARLFSL
ncbi:MAG: host specificity protein [Planctomycetia bacterium]|nr:host specificity protein [Planctomycetia bacterium]